MSSQRTLELIGLNVAIHPGLSLQDIELSIRPGEVAAVIGPNGAGKTSLLRAICDELESSAGRVELNQRSWQEWPQQQRARIVSILPQRSTLEFPFTVSEVVNLGRIPHSTSAQENHRIVSAALELTDCAQFAEQFYLNLSGGEKQRVQLARVAAQIWSAQADNRCLILDEPSASLDLAHQARIVEMIRFFAEQGVAVVTVLHDLNLASKCADKFLLLDDGKVVASGSAEEVLTEQIIADTFAVQAQVRTNERDGSRLVIT